MSNTEVSLNLVEVYQEIKENHPNVLFENAKVFTGEAVGLDPTTGEHAIASILWDSHGEDRDLFRDEEANWKEVVYEYVLYFRRVWKSDLQKAVRRGEVDRAVACAYFGLQQTQDGENGWMMSLIKRLAVIAVEDVGVANPAAFVATTYYIQRAEKEGIHMSLVKLARFLAQSKTSQLANCACQVTAEFWECEEQQVLSSKMTKVVGEDDEQEIADDLAEKMLEALTLDEMVKCGHLLYESGGAARDTKEIKASARKNRASYQFEYVEPMASFWAEVKHRAFNLEDKGDPTELVWKALKSLYELGWRKVGNDSNEWGDDGALGLLHRTRLPMFNAAILLFLHTKGNEDVFELWKEGSSAFFNRNKHGAGDLHKKYSTVADNPLLYLQRVPGYVLDKHCMGGPLKRTVVHFFDHASLLTRSSDDIIPNPLKRRGRAVYKKLEKETNGKNSSRGFRRHFRARDKKRTSSKKGEKKTPSKKRKNPDVESSEGKSSKKVKKSNKPHGKEMKPAGSFEWESYTLQGFVEIGDVTNYSKKKVVAQLSTSANRPIVYHGYLTGSSDPIVWKGPLPRRYAAVQPFLDWLRQQLGLPNVNTCLVYSKEEDAYYQVMKDVGGASASQYETEIKKSKDGSEQVWISVFSLLLSLSLSNSLCVFRNTIYFPPGGGEEICSGESLPPHLSEEKRRTGHVEEAPPVLF